jgi:hypothetical protein
MLRGVNGIPPPGADNLLAHFSPLKFFTRLQHVAHACRAPAKPACNVAHNSIGPARGIARLIEAIHGRIPIAPACEFDLLDKRPGDALPVYGYRVCCHDLQRENGDFAERDGCAGGVVFVEDAPPARSG